MFKRLIAYGVLVGMLLGYVYYPYKSIDPELNKYYNMYLGMIKLNCPELKYNNPGQIIIKFDNLKEDELGYCLVGSNRYIIAIDKQYWKRASRDEQYDTVFHELTHCVLLEDHVTNPNNYMFPYASHLLSTEVFNQTLENIQKKCEKQKNESATNK